MSFRISVESIIYRTSNTKKEVLLVKRAMDCKVAPGVWNVPAGKVNILETTSNAVVRETQEETMLKVEIVKLLAETAFEIKIGDETVCRNMFTYLTRQIDDSQQVEINHEHSQFKWVTMDLLESEQYISLMPRLKDLIIKVLE